MTRPQINVLTDGMVEVSEIQAEAYEDSKAGRGRGRWVNYDKKGNKVIHNMKSATDIFELASIPGFSLTPRARKALQHIAEKRANEAAKDASNSG